MKLQWEINMESVISFVVYVAIPLARPVGSFCMTAFGAYCHAKGISMDTAIHAVFDGAFPAWGLSRHVHKQKELDGKTNEKEQKGIV